MSAPEFTTEEMVAEIVEQADFYATSSFHADEAGRRSAALYRAIAARLSDPWSAFAGWQPPPEAERGDGFRCLGMWSTRWVVCEWTDVGHAETRMGWLPFPNGHTAITPTAFAPLPPPPKESTDG